MKYVVTTMVIGDTKQVINQQMLPAETDNIKHELIELETFEEKAGFTQEVVYDNELKSYKFEYREVPKTEIEKLQEELEKTNQALQDFMLLEMGGSE